LDAEIQKRKNAAERYFARLGNTAGIRLCPPQEGVRSNYAYFPVVFDGYRYTRDELFARLQEAGITARKYFYPLTSAFECYKEFPTAGAEKTPIAARIADQILCLPLYAGLTEQDVDRICDIILN
jgi:dTDP-4-amino-4,6-dideoxygalactose transaminase